MILQDNASSHADSTEFLTFAVNTGDTEDCTRLLYEDDTLWLSRRMMAAMYGVSLAEIKQHIDNICTDSEQDLSVKNYLPFDTEGPVNDEEQICYNLRIILDVGDKINNERAILFRKWVEDIAGDYEINGLGSEYKKRKAGTAAKKAVFLILTALAILLLGWIAFNSIASHRGVQEMKPVIYLYPEESMQVDVKLEYSGKLTCTYPLYRDGWTVTAHPDGALTDAGGQTYNYLYWEGTRDAEYDFSQGFCVQGCETAVFLEDALNKLGLNRKEANEFIVYWLPLMQENPYNIISFQTEKYTQSAKLLIEPAPDTMIRVFMAWKPADCFVDIPMQKLECDEERKGFTVVEWGGVRIRSKR